MTNLTNKQIDEIELPLGDAFVTYYAEIPAWQRPPEKMIDASLAVMDRAKLGDRFFSEAQVREIIASLIAEVRTGREAIQVKPLKWTGQQWFTDQPWRDANLLQRIGHHNLGPYAGSYSVYELEPNDKWGWRSSWTSDRYPDGVEDTEEAAMAAAQADYTARILSALASPTPAPEREWKPIEEAARRVLMFLDDYMVVSSLTANDVFEDAKEELRAALDAALQPTENRI